MYLSKRRFVKAKNGQKRWNEGTQFVENGSQSLANNILKHKIGIKNKEKHMHMGGGGEKKKNHFSPPVKKIPANAPLIPLEMSTSFRIIGLLYAGNGYFLHQKIYVFNLLT